MPQAVESDTRLRLWSSLPSGSLVGLLFPTSGATPLLDSPLGESIGRLWGCLCGT